MTIALISRPESIQMAEAKPFKIELPDAERGRDQRDLDRLDVLNARLAKPPKPRGRMSADDTRKADLAERAELERRPNVLAERQWARDAAEETATLATARGAEIQRSPGGRLEIVSHDALRRLLQCGKLSPEQHEAGEALRECYEMRSSDANSQLANLVQSGTAHDNHSFVGTRFTRAMASNRAQAVELAVLTGMFRLKDGSLLRIEAHQAFAAHGAPQPHLALAVLRKVCAENIGLTEQGRGRAFERNSKALLIALDITHECLMGSRARRG